MTRTLSKPAEGIAFTRPAGSGEQAQTAITRRYDRLAGLYDLYTQPMEWAGLGRRRRRLLASASGNTLEVGIGTGRSLDYYPADIRLVGIDVAPRMLQRAAQRAAQRGLDVRLRQADVQQLPFPSRLFDTVLATCVFCSVADPVRGLAELGRVVRADGKVLLLEHVRPRGCVLGWLADRISPLTRRVLGFNLNRRPRRIFEPLGWRWSRCGEAASGARSRRAQGTAERHLKSGGFPEFLGGTRAPGGWVGAVFGDCLATTVCRLSAGDRAGVIR